MKKILLAAFAVLISSPASAAYDLPYIGEMQEYRTEFEDTFVHVARDYNLGYVELRAANPFVDPWLPGEGTTLTMPTMHLLPDAPHEGIVINLADLRLYAFINGDNEPFSTPVGIGREGLNTPIGMTTVIRKVEAPTWTPTARMREEDPTLPPVVPPGDDNPLGTHALYLGFDLIRIHGTNKPFGIGRRTSSGCLRLYPEAIIPLYEKIPVGTKVTVVNQPIKVAWVDNVLYLEASPTVEQSVLMEENGEVPETKLTNDEMKMIIKTAGAYKDRLVWPTIRKAIKERNSYPVAIARRPSVVVDGDEIVEMQMDEAVDLNTPDEALDILEGYEAPDNSEGAAIPAELEEERHASADAEMVSEEGDQAVDQPIVESEAPSLTSTLNP